jgi:hypothetical protein
MREARHGLNYFFLLYSVEVLKCWLAGWKAVGWPMLLGQQLPAGRLNVACCSQCRTVSANGVVQGHVHTLNLKHFNSRCLVDAVLPHYDVWVWVSLHAETVKNRAAHDSRRA